MEEKEYTLTRKSFLKGAAFAGFAALAGGSLGACAPNGSGNAPEKAAPKNSISGTYVGTAEGMGGDLRMEVTLDEGRIVDVRPHRNNETPGLTDLSFRLMPQEMVANQSFEVDNVTGATMTSTAIKNAVKNALENAGADTKDYNEKVERKKDAEDETVETEFVVVGSGGAGLSAAVTLAQNGKQVVIVEKMPRLGGNTLVCGALMNAWDPIRTKGTEYEANTVQDFIDWTWEGGNEAGKMDLIQAFAEQSWPTTQWLVDEIGVVFYKDLQGAWGHMPEDPNGLGFIYPLVKKVEEFAVPCFLNASLIEISMADGRATGIVAEKDGGGILTVNASKGVILATGGLGHNLEMVKELDPRYENVNLSTNPVNATGECFAIAEAAGANLINMDSIQAVHFADPASGQVDWDIESANSIFVNKEGKRFMNEEMPRDDSVAGLSQQTDQLMFTISDSRDWPTMDTVTGFGVTIGECIERGKAYKADTLEELAAMLEIDPDGLVATVNEYNAMVEAGEDTAFHLETIGRRSKIEEGPFYSSKLTIAIHYTNGGIEIDPQAHVLDASGAIIPGLYAAGECTGGVMGTNRMGGNSVADVMIFGRIAGMAE
ncbi:flavocytochrome c [Raoultibacter massiliensis]|uniref:flavocytochrome c n=1 Tax=Raoultibacter massiliensis TaxID=1852371 RepID=UPI003A93862C